MSVSETYLIAMIIIFTVPYRVWRILKLDYYAPLVVVQIIGGVLLGQGILGAVAPQYYGLIFKPEVIGALNGGAWWAVMIFVWVAGIELDLKKAWADRRETGLTAAFALGAPLALGCVGALLMLEMGESWIGAGTVLDSDMFDQKQMDAFRNHVLLAIMPVFFLSTGLRTNWEVGGVVVFAAAAILLTASVAGKLAGVHLAGRILGWRKGEATVIGWLLQTKALIMIIFVNILLDKEIISSEAFTATLLMAIGSTMLTIPVVTPRLARLSGIVSAEPEQTRQ